MCMYCPTGHITAVEMLLKYKAKVQQRNSQGQLPLDVAKGPVQATLMRKTAAAVVAEADVDADAHADVIAFTDTDVCNSNVSCEAS